MVTSRGGALPVMCLGAGGRKGRAGRGRRKCEGALGGRKCKGYASPGRRGLRPKSGSLGVGDGGKEQMSSPKVSEPPRHRTKKRKI